MMNEPAVSNAEELSGSACWTLLRGVSVGRLAVWVEEHPEIFPINYTVDHGTLVFRTGEGTKLAATQKNTPVALEADGVDADTGVAWSVVVKGTTARIRSIEGVTESFSLLLFPWHSGRKDAFVRISPTMITGRQFRVVPPIEWWTAHAWPQASQE